jgi:hypothetical protein
MIREILKALSTNFHYNINELLIKGLKNMVFWQTFLLSIKLPSKQAVFKLNRIAMDTTIFYMFLLLLIVSIPSLVDQLSNTTGIGSEMNIVFQLIYFFMFYYLILTIMVFVMITVLAYIFTWIAKVMHRKLKLQILWKMIAYTATIPFILYAIFAIFFPISDAYLLMTMVYTIIVLTRVIVVYPKRN